MISVLRPPSRAWPAGLALAALLAVGCIGTYRYLANYWTYRGFAPPKDAAFVKVHGHDRAVLRREPGARGPPPAGRRLPPARVRRSSRPPLPGPLPPARRAGTAGRVPRHRPDGSRPGRARRVAPRAADDPRDAVRLDGVVHRQGMGERGRLSHGGGRPSLHATSSDRSTRATGRSAAAAARALAGLSEGGYGALNIGIHHPGEFRMLESWSGYQRADDIGAIFGHVRALLRRNSPQRQVGASAAPCAARTPRSGSTAARATATSHRTGASHSSWTSLGLRHRFFVVRGGHNWALWRGNAARAYLAASRGLRGA